MTQTYINYFCYTKTNFSYCLEGLTESQQYLCYEQAQASNNVVLAPACCLPKYL